MRLVEMASKPLEIAEVGARGIAPNRLKTCDSIGTTSHIDA